MKYLTLCVFVLFIIASCNNKNLTDNDKIKEIERKALQGDINSQIIMSTIYYKGLGVDVNYTEYFKWVKMAADAGESKSQIQVAKAYLDGIGTGIDYNKVYEYCTKSANNGNRDAYYLVGYCYVQGIGIQKDLGKGLMWYIISKETRYNEDNKFNMLLLKYKEVYPEIYKKANVMAEEWLKSSQNDKQ